MDIVAEPSRGLNIVAEPKALTPYYPAPEVDAAFVEVFWQEVDAATGALIGEPNPVGRMPRGAAGSFQYTPVSDKKVRLFALPYNVHGVPAVPDLNDATTEDIDFTPPVIAGEFETVEAMTGFLVGGDVVVGARQPAVPDATAPTGSTVAGTAGAAYTPAEQALINDLVTTVNALKVAADELQTTTNTFKGRIETHGLIET
jgi:hypothetical protein